MQNHLKYFCFSKLIPFFECLFGLWCSSLQNECHPCQRPYKYLQVGAFHHSQGDQIGARYSTRSSCAGFWFLKCLKKNQAFCFYLGMIPVSNNKLMTFQSNILLFIHDYNFLFSSFFAIMFLQTLENWLKMLAAVLTQGRPESWIGFSIPLTFMENGWQSPSYKPSSFVTLFPIIINKYRKSDTNRYFPVTVTLFAVHLSHMKLIKTDFNADNTDLTAQGIMISTFKGVQCTLRWGCLFHYWCGGQHVARVTGKIVLCKYWSWRQNDPAWWNWFLSESYIKVPSDE